MQGVAVFKLPLHVSALAPQTKHNAALQSSSRGSKLCSPPARSSDQRLPPPLLIDTRIKCTHCSKKAHFLPFHPLIHSRKRRTPTFRLGPVNSLHLLANPSSLINERRQFSILKFFCILWDVARRRTCFIVVQSLHVGVMTRKIYCYPWVRVTSKKSLCD